MAHHFEIRAAQIDLGRQMESVDFICNFIDFIAEHNFNTLFLYLEWRVRTKTVDLGPGNGYSAPEIKKIIQYASKKGIDVIPGLASIGHAALLLSDEKFAHLCELHGNVKGRFFGSPKQEFCLSDPAVKTMLEQYFAEIAALFPSPYMHIGGDESFNIGYCKECAKQAETYDGEQKLYGDMVHFCHSVITGKLGKRVMMWDDMYELYPDAFHSFPRDIIMVSWSYGRNTTGWFGHFANCTFRDQLAYYEKEGFDYLIAPADRYWSNTETFTDLVKNRKCLGGLLTIWEKKFTLLYKSLPNLAVAGDRWGKKSGASGDQIIHKSLAKIFHTNDDTFLHAMEQYLEIYAKGKHFNEETLTIHNFSGPNWFFLRSLRTMTDIFVKHQNQCGNAFSNAILDDIIADLILLEAGERLRIAAYKAVNHLQAESFDDIAADVASAWKQHIALCRKTRTKEDVGYFRTMQEKSLKLIADFRNKIETCGTLKILLCLPDLYEAQFVKIRIKSGGKWKDVEEGVYKSLEESLHTKVLFIPANLSIQEVEISSRGFGGQGVCYVSAETDKGKFVPAGITFTSGDVSHPDYLLKPDATFAYLGFQQTLESFHDRAKAESTHTIRLIMKKA